MGCDTDMDSKENTTIPDNPDTINVTAIFTNNSNYSVNAEIYYCYGETNKDLAYEFTITPNETKNVTIIKNYILISISSEENRGGGEFLKIYGDFCINLENSENSVYFTKDKNCELIKYYTWLKK